VDWEGVSIRGCSTIPQCSHELWTDNDMITMFEEAYKKQPHHEELGVQTFFAIVRTGNWKAAQQVWPVINVISVSDRRCAARHENAQTVSRRSLHLLERHQCCPSGEFIIQTRRIHSHDTFFKGQRPIYPGIYASHTLQTLASSTFLND
jgi:hypothetical protein